MSLNFFFLFIFQILIAVSLHKNFNIAEFVVFEDTGSSLLSLNSPVDLFALGLHPGEYLPLQDIAIDTAIGRVIRQMTAAEINFKDDRETCGEMEDLAMPVEPGYRRAFQACTLETTITPPLH